MNTITITGNFTRDVEIKDLDGGKRIAKVGIASDRGRKSTKTDFLDLIGWDEVADAMNEHGRGAFVRVRGSLTVRDYEHEGQKRRAYEVVVRKVEALAKNEDAGA